MAMVKTSPNRKPASKRKATQNSSKLSSERTAALGGVADHDPAKMVPPPPGIYLCRCERCEMDEDVTPNSMLEWIFQVASPPHTGRIWSLISVTSKDAVERIRRDFAVAGILVAGERDLERACQDVLGRYFFVELLPGEAGNTSDRIHLLQLATTVNVASPTPGFGGDDAAIQAARNTRESPWTFPHGEQNDDIPHYGGDLLRRTAE